VPKHIRRSRKTIVIATVSLGVLGAGFAGVASAGTVPWRHHRPAAVQHPVVFGDGARVFRSGDPDWRHHPRPTSSSTMAPPTTAPTTEPPATLPPTSAPTASVPPSTPPVTTPPATTPPATTPPSADTVVQQMLDHINAARAKQNLPGYKLDASLIKVADSHAANMANGCGLSHKCPNEGELGDRFNAAGVKWNSIGENIGQGNAANTDASKVQNGNGLTDLMLGEGPGGGHYENLMSKGFTRVGLSVVLDGSGKLWLSQDFAN
jgi:uncharacterized protein YkwD